MEIKFKQKTKKGIVNINLPVEVNFVVNKEKGTVAAIAIFKGDEAFRVASRFMDNAVTPERNMYNAADYLTLLFAKRSEFFDNVFMPPYCHVTTHCSPDDVFNEEEGIRIAEERMKEKLTSMILHRVRKIGRELEKYGKAMCKEV